MYRCVCIYRINCMHYVKHNNFPAATLRYSYSPRKIVVLEATLTIYAVWSQSDKQASLLLRLQGFKHSR